MFVGCSLGYCLDTYKHMSLREINLQVNKQANAGLQRIREQLAYMTPQNFVYYLFIYFSEEQRKLEVLLLEYRLYTCSFLFLHFIT